MEREQISCYLEQMGIGELVEHFPYVQNFFDAIRMDVSDETQSVMDLLGESADESFADYGLTKVGFACSIIDFIEQFGLAVADEANLVDSVTVLGGTDKDGKPENLELTVQRGEIVCIVGPTGAGKSRLLEDIESLAQGDSPSRRTVLVNGAVPSDDMRYALDNRLVAQITQNMNFVIDLTVAEFVRMHAESRDIDDESLVDQIIECANALSGEAFSGDTPVTQLSGGQSRALMTADTALLSASPIILIDEIENAGIDRAQALDLLTDKGKIVFLSTHDPVLALSGARRAIVSNGAVVDVLESSQAEHDNLAVLQAFDAFMLDMRDKVRSGMRLDNDIRSELMSLLVNPA